MDPWQKETLIRKRDYIVDNLYMGGLLTLLLSRGAIDMRTKNQIECHKSTYDQVESLLDALIEEQGSDTFDIFMKCLYKSEQGHIADSLQRYLAVLHHHSNRT